MSTLLSAKRIFPVLIIVALGAILFPVLSRAADDASGVKGLVGKPAPEINLTTVDQKSFKLSDHKGKVIVVDLWATWCGPCLKSLPNIQKLSEDESLRDKGLVVIAPNVGEDKATVSKFLDAKKYTFTVLMDEKATLNQSLGVTGIPTTLVIGRDGVVKKVIVGLFPAVGDQASSEDQLHQAIEAALNEKAG